MNTTVNQQALQNMKMHHAQMVNTYNERVSNRQALHEGAFIRNRLNAEAHHASEAWSTLAEFNVRVGLKPMSAIAHERIMLNDLFRKVRRARQSEASARAGHGADAHGDDELLSAEAAKLKTVLHEGGAGAMKDWMRRHFDPLERYALLRHALDNGGGAGDKAALSEAMRALMHEHGDTLSTALQDAAALQSAIDRLNTLARAGGAAELRGLRSLFNSGEPGKPEQPTTALALATRLQERFGADHFAVALKEARAAVGAQMRRESAELGPRMWLSMSDAASFKAIQSAFAIGCDLRRQLSDANVFPRAKEGEAAIALLSAAGPEPEPPAKLADRFVQRDALPARQKATAYRLIGHALDKLPVILWADEKLPQRMELIGELRMLGGAAAEGARQPRESKAARLERLLREEIARARKPAQSAALAASEGGER